MTVTQLPPGNFVQLPARPLTLDDVTYLRTNDELHRFELVEGNLLVMPLPDAGHTAIADRVAAWLAGCGYHDRVRTAAALRTAERSGRTPDVLVLRRPATAAADWITSAETALVVEVVSATSETLDRTVKPAEYARAGITHYWRVERDGPSTVHLYRLGIDE
ncbi:MAG TPA: Uma2 family endonuclease, partial [Micromonosporaceae bacterium]|nr:Uma2 family endonuclease [Micromonosporaceae bacterium]